MNIINEYFLKKVNDELNELLRHIEKINNFKDLQSLEKIIDKMKYFYKKLISINFKGIENAFLEPNYGLNIKCVLIGNNEYIKFIDSIIIFWIRCIYIEEYNNFIICEDLNKIIFEINNNSINNKKIKIKHDCKFIKECAPFLIFIWKEIITKEFNLIEIKWDDKPDFVLIFKKNEIKYLKPIEVTTINDFDLYDSDITSQNNIVTITNGLKNKKKKRSEYDENIKKLYKDKEIKILNTMIVATTVYSYIKKEKIDEIISSLKDEKINDEEYHIEESKDYFYLIYYLIDEKHENEYELRIINRKLINKIIKKWNVDIKKYNLEWLEICYEKGKIDVKLVSKEKQTKYRNLNPKENICKDIIDIINNGKWNSDCSELINSKYKEEHYIKSISLYVSNDEYELNSEYIKNTHKDYVGKTIIGGIFKYKFTKD